MAFQTVTKLVFKSIRSIKNRFEHADNVHNSNAGRLGGIYPSIYIIMFSFNMLMYNNNNYNNV